MLHMTLYYFSALSFAIICIQAGNQEGVHAKEEGQLDLSLTKHPVGGECTSKAETLRKLLQFGDKMNTMCSSLEWNTTYKSNLLGVSTVASVNSFWLGNFDTLVQLKCSSNTELLFCSVAVPICHGRKTDFGGENQVYIIPPCYELCEQVKFGCKSSLNTYGFSWPFDCSKLPSSKRADNPSAMCVPPTIIEYDRPQPAGEKDDTSVNEEFLTAMRGNTVEFTCPSKLRVKSSLGYSFLGAKDCSAPCKGVLFSDSNYKTARYWIGAWSFVCFMSSLFTVFTYLVDRQRFKYPEKPIIILSSCYVFISATFLIGFYAQTSLSCRPPSNDLGTGDEQIVETDDDQQQIVTQAVSHAGCTIMFIVLYYFLMASCLWWVVLSFTWLLAACFKWSPEAIDEKAVAYHVVGWGIPLVQTALVLFFQGIEGDDLSGTCFTGMLNVNFTRFFVLLPLMLFLGIGFTFLVFGFISLCRVRHFIKKNGDRTDKLEKLMIRIGIFSLFYMIPALILIACFLYEQNYRHNWHVSWWRQNCPIYTDIDRLHECFQFPGKNVNGGISSDNTKGDNLYPTANFYVFLLRYFVTLAVGVTSSFWLWSKKTLDSWKNVFCINSQTVASKTNNACVLPTAQPVNASPRKQMLANNTNHGAFAGPTGTAFV